MASNLWYLGEDNSKNDGPFRLKPLDSTCVPEVSTQGPKYTITRGSSQGGKRKGQSTIIEILNKGLFWPPNIDSS